MEELMKKLWRILLRKYAALGFLCTLIALFTACPNITPSGKQPQGNTQQNETPQTKPPTGNGQHLKSTAVTVNVIDSVGGVSVMEPTTLTVYKAGTAITAYGPVTVTNGTVQLSLPKDQCYDLHLSGKKDKLAASVIENYWVRSEKAQTVTMIQRVVQIGALTQAPSIQSVTLNSVPFQDGDVWAGTRDQTMNLNIVFRAPSRAIQARPTDTNFGCAVGIGSAPSFHNNIASTSPVCTREADGSWKCTAHFAFSAISFPNEFNDFIITAYDVAGNRVERHINYIEFKERRPGLRTMTGAHIKGFRVEMRRFPHSLKLFNIPEQSGYRPFGIMPHNGESNTYEVLLWFQIKDFASRDLPIRGFYIYRRKQGESEWTLVGRKQYAKDYTGDQDTRFTEYKGFHLGYDTDPALEEGVTYEYKVSPFVDSNQHLDSHTATARLLPANTIQLEYPADNGTVKKSEINKLSFSFKITNPDIWEKKQADSFSFGLLITEKTSAQEIIFAGKMTVYLKKSAGNRLGLQYSISGNPKEYSFKELQNRGYIPVGAVEDDFVSYANGMVTIKSAYLNNKAFNHPLFKDKEFTTGSSYGWDIFDWGKDAKEKRDDEPAVFTAIWPSKDADGNIIIPSPTEPLSSSESFANGLRYAGSLNGQYFFKVTNE
jgi:prcAII